MYCGGTMNAKIIDLPDTVLEKMAGSLRVLAHPDRLKIIEVLEKGNEVTVGEIEIALKRPQSVISQHLGLMKRAGLLESERSGKNVCYHISDDRPLMILNCIRNKITQMKEAASK